MSLYQSGYTPRGIRRDWDRSAMDGASTARVLGDWAKNTPVKEAVAWFDEDDALRVLVADLDGGRRITVRQGKNTKIELGRTPA